MTFRLWQYFRKGLVTYVAACWASSGAPYLQELLSDLSMPRIQNMFAQYWSLRRLCFASFCPTSKTDQNLENSNIQKAL